MPKAAAAALGRRGEQLAAELLEKRGWTIVARGFLATRGELDLVARRGDRLLVVEVKTRSSNAFGAPAEAVGPHKRRALEAAAAEYRAMADWRGPIDHAIVALIVDRDGRLVSAELIE